MEKDEELYEELKQEGYKNAVDFCIRNWDKLTLQQKQMLKAVGVSPEEMKQ